MDEAISLSVGGATTIGDTGGPTDEFLPSMPLLLPSLGGSLRCLVVVVGFLLLAPTIRMVPFGRWAVHNIGVS